MLKLTPNVYKNIRWALAPQNKIDTLYMYPSSNVVPEAPQRSTTSVTSVNINNSSVALPLTNGYKSTHVRSMSNSRTLFFAQRECAKARTECVMASGKQKIKLDSASIGTPFVKLVPRGHSYLLSRGKSTFDTYPSINDINNSNYSIVQWIIDNADVHNSTSLVNDYSTGYVNMNPWVRKIVPAVITSFNNINVPEAADIITTWVNPDQGGALSRYGALQSDWKDTNNFDPGASTVTMFPTNPSGSDIASVLQTAIRLQDLRINFSCNLQKLTDFDFEVTWTAPVRFAYVAASRQYGNLMGEYDLDNYAYVDIIEAIDIVLEFYTLSDDRVDLGYSLDVNGALTTNVKNVYPLKLDGNEIFSRNAAYAAPGNGWCELLALNVLEDCKLGEYIIQCEVPAKWALRNNVHIGTEMHIYQLNGEYIPDIRSEVKTPATFYVKNIQKNFSSDQFTYELKLSTKGG